MKNLTLFQRWAVCVVALTALVFLAAAPALMQGSLSGATFWGAFIWVWPAVLIVAFVVASVAWQ